MNQPKNESEAHFLLKEVAKYVLWARGYTMLATEVHDMYSFDGIGRNRKKGLKNTMDVVGVKCLSKHIPKQGYKYHYVVCGIEAKASLADFRNGYCCAPAITYIIAPKGVIPVALIPDKIGLIEVDFKKLSISRTRMNKIDELEGVSVTVKAKRRIDSRFEDVGRYRAWCREMLDTVAYRCSQELLFWRNVIEFAKAKEGEEGAV